MTDSFEKNSWKSNEYVKAILKNKWINHPVLGFSVRVGLFGMMCGVVGSFLRAGIVQLQSNVGVADRWLPVRMPVTLSARRYVEDGDVTRRGFYILTFKLPSESDFLGYHPISALQLRFSNVQTSLRGERQVFETLTRLYNPISHPETPGYFEIALKMPRAYGRVANHLRVLPLGSKVEVCHFMKEFQYRPNEYETVSMLMCGGGITPAMQLLTCALADRSDKTQFRIFAMGEQQPPMQKKLEEAAARYPDRVKIQYAVQSLNFADPNFSGVNGLLVPDDLRSFLPPPEDRSSYGFTDKVRRAVGLKQPKNKILICGSMRSVLRFAGMQPRILGKTEQWWYFQGPFGGMLKDLGYAKNEVYKFGNTAKLDNDL